MQKKKISVSLALVVAVIVVLVIFILIIKACNKTPEIDLADNIVDAQAVDNNEIKEFADKIVKYILEDDFENLSRTIDYSGYFAYRIANKKDKLLTEKNDGVKLVSDKFNFETLYAYCKSFDSNGYDETVEKYKNIYTSKEEYGAEQEMDVFKIAMDETAHKIEDIIIKEIYENYNKEIKIKNISKASKSNIADYIYKVDVGVNISYYKQGQQQNYKGSDIIYLIKRTNKYRIIYSDWLQGMLDENNVSLTNTIKEME